jgi:hypothetical protein
MFMMRGAQILPNSKIQLLPSCKGLAASISPLPIQILIQTTILWHIALSSQSLIDRQIPEDLKLGLSVAEVQQVLMARRLWWASKFRIFFNEDQLLIKALADTVSTGESVNQ